MKIGLVGLPEAGKSTVFGALTGLEAPGGPGGGGDKARIGVVKVPDPRVDALAALFQPKKKTYAEITFLDAAGAHAPGGGSGLDRSALNAMRNLDALCQVVRAFPSASGQAAAPLREIETLTTETILADLEVVEQRLARLAKERGPSREREVPLLERLREALESEHALREIGLTADERRAVAGYTFLSLKPLLLVLNVAEEEVAAPPPPEIERAAKERGLGLVVLSAEVERDIARMPEAEQAEFLASLGLAEPASHRFIRAAFELLDLVSMLTAGPDECRAWPIPRNTLAPRAAGKIHSDIERGFIRAEVVPWQDLVELGSEARCREAGKLRVEGKAYVVQDGDVVHFRFNV
jgi:GTP-binding protein YchF